MRPGTAQDPVRSTFEPHGDPAAPPRGAGPSSSLPPPAADPVGRTEPPPPSPMPQPGVDGLWFAPPERHADACRELASRRFLVAAVAILPPSGGLRLVIEEAVEGALAMRGALPPCVEVGAALGASVEDQLFRVRTLGVRGLGIALPRLADAAPGGRLGAEDSAALTAWMEAAKSRPVVLLMDERDRAIEVHTVRTLGELAAPLPAPLPASPVSPSPALSAALAPPVVTQPVLQPLQPLDLSAEPAQRPRRSLERDLPAGGSVGPLRRTSGEQKVVQAAEWRSFAMELDEARGPKPVRVVDRLFATRYMPLLGAEARGEVDGAVRTVIEAWRVGFEHSYRDAYASLRVTGKRPPMVLDAPDVATRVGRLNGARAIHLLLVDAMRFDLGERITERLGELVVGRAVCVDRSLLWSALPTTTPTQLALLARGPEALKDPPPTSEREPDVSRGRAISSLRRERVGGRDVLKLDLVEARMRSAGPALDERLDAVADEIAPLLARHIETLPPRTLLLVFGDHGFRVVTSPDGLSTSAATQGGASPEEVLVPAYAWLVGGVH
jgi:hypothetical protein